jgi:hypothetical protein
MLSPQFTTGKKSQECLCLLQLIEIIFFFELIGARGFEIIKLLILNFHSVFSAKKFKVPVVHLPI